VVVAVAGDMTTTTTTTTATTSTATTTTTTTTHLHHLIIDSDGTPPFPYDDSSPCLVLGKAPLVFKHWRREEGRGGGREEAGGKRIC